MTLNRSPRTQTLWWLSLLLLIAFVCPAQQSKKNVVYGELAGAGILYSVNYERIIVPNLTARIGVSAWPAGESMNLVLPVLVNFLAGSGSSKLEIGAGTDVIVIDQTKHGHMSNYTNNSLEAGFLVVGSLGYRYQPSDGGFHFRIVASPIFAPITGYFFPSIGCSAGICF